MNLEIEALGERQDLRNAFIREFVRKTPDSDIYHNHIEKTWMKNGLPYYSGFLWEFLFYYDEMDSVVISESEGLRLLGERDTVLFMFDFFDYEANSSYKAPKVDPFVRRDWQHILYKARASCLPELIREDLRLELLGRINADASSPVKLPDSVYLFDESLTWYLAFTGEDLSDGQRLCFKCFRGS